MGVLDGPLRAVSKTVIDTFGTAGTLTHRTEGAYNVTTGTSTPTTSTTAVNGTLSDYSANERGDGIRATDLKFTIPAASVTTAPDPDDTVTIDGTVYQVVDVRPTYSGDQVAIYELQLRA